MYIAILSKEKWLRAKGNLEEYKKLGGRTVENKNKEIIESTMKYTMIEVKSKVANKLK